jgi:hypothetical protein
VKVRYLRVLLRTFAIGLAAVWIFAGFKIAWRDKSVDLPPASEDVLYVYPETDTFNYCCSGGGGGSTGSFVEQSDDVPDRTKAAVINLVLTRFPHDTSANDEGKLFLAVSDSVIRLLPKKIDGHRVSNGSELLPSPWSNYIYFRHWKQEHGIVYLRAITALPNLNALGCDYRFAWTNKSRRLLSSKCYTGLDD